jgi:formylglycine-generating enzyme required for sulfatase activity
MEQDVPYLLGQLIGALVPTFLVSRLLLWLLRGWNAGLGRIAFAHTLSLLICALIAGIGRADGGAFAPLEAGLAYLLPQGAWFVVDLIRARARGRAAHVSTASNSAAPPPPAIPASGTPGARAWALIQNSLDPADYQAFEAHFSGTPEVLLAARHRRQLEAWAQIDKNSPEALKAFLQTRPFEALAAVVRGSPGPPAQPQPTLGTEATAPKRPSLPVAAALVISGIILVAFAGYVLVQPTTLPPGFEVVQPPREPAALVPSPEGLPDFQAFRECEGCPEMVVLPAGAFMMGSPEWEPSRMMNEDDRAFEGGSPISVALPRFAIGRFEITWEQWDLCVAGGDCEPLDSMDGRAGESDDRPAQGVSWMQAQVFINWLNQQAGVSEYRLPSEAEWEYAARGGTASSYFWGYDPSAGCQYMNAGDQHFQATFDLAEEVAIFACSDGFAGPAPVGSFLPNPFGLFDMAGNVSEWVSDSYQLDLSRTPRSGLPFIGEGFRGGMVTRGGSFMSTPGMLSDRTRSASRGFDPPETADVTRGLRVARSMD